MNYKERITELANLNYSNEEIKSTIFKEFGITISIPIIINLKEKNIHLDYIDLDKFKESNREIDIYQEIRDLIRFNHLPITLEEIVAKLSNQFNSKFYTGQISNVIHYTLIPSGSIRYDNSDKTYSYANENTSYNIEKPQIHSPERDSKNIINKIDEIIFNNLESLVRESNSFESNEIFQIITNQHSNINFSSKYLKNIEEKTLEKVFKDRLNLFILFVKELKTIIKYIFNQNSKFTINQLFVFRNNNIILTDKSIDIISLLNGNIKKYIEQIEEKSINSTFKTKNYLGLKKLDEKIPEIIYFLNNIRFEDFEDHFQRDKVQDNSELINDADIKIENIQINKDTSRVESITTAVAEIIKKESSSTLNNYLKQEIQKNITVLYGTIKLSQSAFLEEILYIDQNQSPTFNLEIEEDKTQLLKKIQLNLSIVNRFFKFLSRITNNLIEISSVVRVQDDEIIFTKDDIISFKKIFNQIINIDIYYIKIIDEKKFNETKDEIEFLFEAYEKLFNDLTGNKINSAFPEKVEIKSQTLVDDTEKNDFEINNKSLELGLFNTAEIKESDVEKKQAQIINKKNLIDINQLFKIINEEKYRLGSPIVNQFVENIKKRIKDSI